MKKVQQEVMCVLLQTLLNKKLITQDMHDKSRERILGTLDWPEFFCYAGSAVPDDGKEDIDGSS